MSNHKWIKISGEDSILKTDEIHLCFVEKYYTQPDKEYRIKCYFNNNTHFNSNGLSQSDASKELFQIYQKLNNKCPIEDNPF